ncbi:MAG: hypothetical protein AB7O32_00595 [Vicinamibacterales bacterium]
MASPQSTAPRQPARAGGEVFAASFVHYRTGRRIFAKDYGLRAFCFRPRKGS